VTDWIVRRWARYGHERLYAETPGGTALGYLDLKTGRYHSDDLSNLPLLEEAIGDHFAGTEPKQVTSDAPVEEAEALAVDAPAEPVLPAWEDISGHAAGSAVRERALAARDAQGKVRHFLARAFDVKTEERAWRIGAAGEQAVAAQLAKLGSEWRVLHSVEVGDRGSDIDHVLVGPGGVLTVNAKNHPNANVWVGGDTFMVNGQRKPYVRNSRHEAARAAVLLSDACGFPVHVEGVVVTVNAADIVVKRQPDGVSVVPRMQVAKWLLRHGDILEQSTIDSIYAVARRSTTWRP